ncbi:MAG: hypothetical protein SFY70_11065 [Bacteroidia bacterium]|nr:hypothetical protein [Bacteroidia bacterium]
MQFLKAIVSPRKLFAVIIALGLASCTDQDPEPQSNGIVAPKGNFTVSVADGKIVSNNMEYIKSFPQLEQALQNIAAKNSHFSIEVGVDHQIKINGSLAKSAKDLHEFLISQGGFQLHTTDFYLEVTSSEVNTNPEKILGLFPFLGQSAQAIRNENGKDKIIFNFDKHGRFKGITDSHAKCKYFTKGCLCDDIHRAFECSWGNFGDCVADLWWAIGINVVACGIGSGGACLC